MSKGSPPRQWALRAAIIIAAAAFIAAGVIRGEQWEIMDKAVKICLECIGIG